MKTKAELRKAVLSSMTVIDPEESPLAEQAKALDVYVSSARGTLSELGLCWWDDNAIPDAAFVPFRNYVRAICCGDFGRAGKGYEAFEEKSITDLSRLKPPAAREETSHEFF